MFTLEYAKNPLLIDENSILLVVKFVEFAEEMEFNASRLDTMPHGVDLYNRAKSGEFGEVGVFVPEPIPPKNP
jgi:hypothetical protein